MTVMMFGMTGSGKSSLGNLIAGFDAFEAGDDTASMTNLESVMKHEAEDASLIVLDTVGLGDTEISQDKVVASIRDVALSAPDGIDVLLFVMRNTRITDDAIARLIYVTEFLWGHECLLNLYVVVTFGCGYVGRPDKARQWIDRQVEINWRFKHIYGLVGMNPNRFIFVDNPDPYAEEPDWENRREQSRELLMKMLCSHPRDVVPPYTHTTMERARELMEERIRNLELQKQEVQRLEKELMDEANSNASSSQLPPEEKPPTEEKPEGEKPKRPKTKRRKQRPTEEVQANLAKAREGVSEAEAAVKRLTAEVQADPIFQQRAEESAAKATQNFRARAINAKDGAASACRRLLTSLGISSRSKLLSSSSIGNALSDTTSAEDTDPVDPSASYRGGSRLARGSMKHDMEEIECGERWEHTLDELMVKVRAVLRGTPDEVFSRLDVASAGAVAPMTFQDFLRACVPTITQQQIGGLWRRADANCDGQLSNEEWTTLFKVKRERRLAVRDSRMSG